ncbi:DUF6538 domain-containing protein [Noviherbaspirillum saxi]|uniref:DUF6538 domain-containing protein n=1 Tax=Noviherbaspirillum saxi TaxID=2320863 RepID=UPI0011C3F572|nr:DUF6538 domain-containing protein [Noviherbaspirillum saxi]
MNPAKYPSESTSYNENRLSSVVQNTRESMLFALSAAVSIKTRYIEKRGNVYQFVMRVPTDLAERFGRDRIRESLKTNDSKEAISKANARLWRLSKPL